MLTLHTSPYWNECTVNARRVDRDRTTEEIVYFVATLTAPSRCQMAANGLVVQTEGFSGESEPLLLPFPGPVMEVQRVVAGLPLWQGMLHSTGHGSF